MNLNSFCTIHEDIKRVKRQLISWEISFLARHLNEAYYLEAQSTQKGINRTNKSLIIWTVDLKGESPPLKDYECLLNTITIVQHD